MQRILIIGATSAIAQATARLYAQRGDSLYLLARNQERLEVITQDLKIRGANAVNCSPFDADDFEGHEASIKQGFELYGGFDVVLVCHGSLPDQQACEKSVTASLNELNINALSTVSLLTHIANLLEIQNSGTIAVVTSVAGDRGRQSNYVYGAAKGMVSIFLQGLRNRLHRCGVYVLDIKPGFVDTPMTAQFEKGFLWVKPATIASDIVKAVDKKRDAIYTPGVWRFIMFVVKKLPESIFKRLSL